MVEISILKRVLVVSSGPLARAGHLVVDHVIVTAKASSSIVPYTYFKQNLLDSTTNYGLGTQ
jgi:hypothetical protein